MERLTTGIEDTVYYSKGKYKPKTLSADMEPWEVRECMQRLATYEDTGLPPEEIEQLKKTCHTAVKLWENTAKRNCELYDEIDKWKNDALTYADQLGMLRIWFESRLGTNMEQVMEDCKTMFPDKAVNKHE